jgi:hypothetical protein
MKIVSAMIAVALDLTLVGTAHAEHPVAPPVVVATLPAQGLQDVPAGTPVTPAQQQTCGCTAPPNPKQKVMVKSGGKNVCTVTQMACWAP